MLIIHKNEPITIDIYPKCLDLSNRAVKNNNLSQINNEKIDIYKIIKIKDTYVKQELNLRLLIIIIALSIFFQNNKNQN